MLARGVSRLIFGLTEREAGCLGVLLNHSLKVLLFPSHWLPLTSPAFPLAASYLSCIPIGCFLPLLPSHWLLPLQALLEWRSSSSTFKSEWGHLAGFRTTFSSVSGGKRATHEEMKKVATHHASCLHFHSSPLTLML